MPWPLHVLLAAISGGLWIIIWAAIKLFKKKT